MGAQTAFRRGRLLRAALFACGVLLLSTPALAHGGALRSAASRSLTVPTWLFLLTGGGAIGASFLLASFVTDRAFIRSVHEWHRSLRASVPRLVISAGRLAGLVVLALVLFFGFAETGDSVTNLAILVVWVGWWAGFTITVYLLGNAWPVLNPWRTVASVLPSGRRSYPEHLGAWPSVVGLLVLIWLEVVSPLADQAHLLATVIVAYSVVTLAGAFVFGTETWFSTVDPVSRVFRYYGRVAPIQRTDAGLRVSLPGADLTTPKLVDGVDEVAFVIALLWVTTYDGLVSTPAWATVAETFVPLGVPPLLLYAVALLLGYGVFLGVYRWAVRASRRTGNTYVSTAALARLFTPSLLPIAAGYHLAHFLGYFLSLSTVLGAVATNPFAPPEPFALVLPAWFGALELTFVLLGHLLAIWVAHAIAYDVFPGRLQAIRSQYPLIVAMVVYTMTSLWIVSQPSVTPPYL